MKRLFIQTLIILICCTRVIGQDKTKFFVFAGPQASTARYYLDGQEQKTSFKFGGMAGVGAKIFFDHNLYFAPAVFYSLKGYKAKFNRFSASPNINAIENNTTIHTAELALLLQYDFKKDNNSDHFFIKLGPSFDFHLFGREKMLIKENNTTKTVKQSMPFGFVDYGRYGINAIVNAGYETTSGWLLYAQYGLGLSDMNNLDGGPFINHRAGSITIGKYLGN